MKALAPLQCGVGIPGACESIGQGLQDVVTALPADEGADWVVLQVDVKNAFNTVHRNVVLQGATSFSPAMYPWLRFLYEQPVHLICQGQSLLSRTGVHQGCPLGPAAFAVGLHSAALSIKMHGLTWGVFYLDDGILVGPAPRVREAFRALRQNMSAVGLEVNRGKCVLWGPGCPPRGNFPDADPLGGIPCEGYAVGTGLKVLGVPVGRPGETATHERLWAKRVQDLQGACDTLASVPDPQLQHCLLRQCLDAAKVQFLLRAADSTSGEVSPHVVAADEAILSVVETMIGMGLPPCARSQVSLPFSEGGGAGFAFRPTSRAQHGWLG